MKKSVLFIASAIILTSLLSASVTIGNSSHSITNAYGPEANLKGWINISIENEFADILLNDSLGNSITLIDLLDTDSNSDVNPICSTADCKDVYSVIGNGETEKIFNLNDGEEKVIGFSISGGNLDSVVFNSMNISSDVTPNCFNQLEIDFFDDGVVDFVNDNALDSTCFNKNYGCFDIDEFSSSLPNSRLGETPICQRIELIKSPGIKAGAYIEKESSEVGDKITFELVKLNGENIPGAFCDLNVSEIQESGGEHTCNLDYSIVEKQEYYLCLSKVGSGVYSIPRYDLGEDCSFYGNPSSSQEEISSYYIFAQPRKFGSMDSLYVTDTLPNGNDFEEMIRIYLDSQYQLDCSKGCTIPIKFISNADQTITLENLDLEYAFSGVAPSSTDSFYDLEKTAPKVDFDFKRISLDNANFTLPKKYDDYDYKLYIKGNKIFEENITISEVPVIESLTPLKTFVGYPTNFKVGLSDNSNITKYTWQLEDNVTKQTYTNEILYTYDYVGYYDVQISAIIDGKEISETFEVFVDSAKNAVNQTLLNYEKRIDSLEKDLESYSSFEKKAIMELIKLSESADKLVEIKRQFVQASSDEKYKELLKELLELDIPVNLEIETQAQSLELPVTEDHVHVTILEEVTGDSANSNLQGYKNAIVAWNVENTDISSNYKKIILKYDSKENQKISLFEINLKNNANSKTHFFVQNYEDLYLDPENSFEEESGYKYKEISEGNNKINLGVKEDISFADLDFFVSPLLNNLNAQSEDISVSEEDDSLGAVFWLLIILLLIAGVVGYVVLQQWYKHKYEDYLFKNKNNLFNLVHYIQNAKKQEKTNSKIESELKKSGWNPEQIQYVMRKYAGKRTGMFELIPVDNLFKLIKKTKDNQFKPKPTQGQIPNQPNPRTAQFKKFAGNI